MNKPDTQTNKNSHTQTTVRWLVEGKEGGEKIAKGERVKYMVREGDLTLSCKHTIKSTDDAL